MGPEARKRVIIERVFPEIDEGEFPIRRIAGEKVDIKAHIIADGHDILSAFVYYRHESESEFKRNELRLLYNDEWFGSFRVEKQGLYIYKVEAYIDHF
ncbi:MAG TPA: DUF3416 domain-containing protein, partial [Candidatus Goldiibacteriota bacterium]|nr:DUF3416 domain-containing protein [Candidatus Goldiibacteriota bacterium]